MKDHSCEYGLPECGKPADFSIPGGRYYPQCMHACAEHVMKMAVTGERPDPITAAGKQIATQYWGYKEL